MFGQSTLASLPLPLKPGKADHGPLPGVKLGIPRVPDMLLQRARVVALLDAAIAVPLTTVIAPAGYGKTTAVAQWATTADLPVSWISLGPEDNNPTRFLGNLIASVKAADPDTLQDALEHVSMFQEWRETMDLVIAAMGLATRHFILVLDDFHCLSNPQLLKVISFLINRLPLQVHLVLIGRAAPALRLARLRANGALYEIGVADLAFSEAESLAFRVAAGIDEVDEAQWATLATRAEGWIAGMQMARLSLSGQAPATVPRFVADFDGRLQEIDEYLLEEVMAALPADLRFFMLRSALLPFLGSDLCDYVLEIDNSTRHLRELRQRNLFVVALGSQSQWLRYHHLFADALQQRLADETDPGEITTIHARAAEWLGKHGYEEQAIRHAIACQRWDLATALVHHVCAPLAVSERVDSMRFWLDLLPKDIVMADPDLKYLLLWSLAITVSFNEAGDALALVDGDMHDPTYPAREHTVRMQTSYALGDVEGMYRHALMAGELIDDELLIPKMFCHIMVATSRYLVGEFDEAEIAFAELQRLAQIGTQPWLKNPGEGRYADALCLRGQLEDAVILLGEVQSSHAMGLHPTDVQPFWFMASIHLERNNLDLAESNLERALHMTDVADGGHWLPPVLITQAMVHWARGDIESAHANAQRARNEAKTLGNPNYVQRADALQVMMWIARGQHILAERWLATANLNLTWVREFNQPYPALAAVRLMSARGQLERAVTRLDEIIAATRTRRRIGDLVRLHAMKAGLLARREEPDRAAEELATAIELGARGGFVRSFLDEGDAIAGLFNHPLVRDHSHRHYAQTVRRAFDGQPTGPTAGGRSQLEALSLRELEVLRLVSSGQSNRRIADDLYISEPTVKKHISNIYGKLNVPNRMQAVSLARELGVL